jgi:hypothetical protein
MEDRFGRGEEGVGRGNYLVFSSFIKSLILL